jgi:predicted transcriptional regulator
MEQRKLTDRREAALPIEIQRLFRRERELASIVYFLGSGTANEVSRALTVELTNASVRSMLNRLVAKGILRRNCDGKAFIYSPALSCRDSQAIALTRFVRDYFNGSVDRAVAGISPL